MAEQTLTAIPMVQAFGAEVRHDDRFRELTKRSGDASLASTAAGLQLRLSASGVTALGTSGVMLVGGLRVQDGAITAGDLLVFLSYLHSLYAPLETLSYLSSGFAGSAASAQRVLEVLDSPEAVPEAPGAPALRLERGGGRLRLERVTFAYLPGQPVLTDVSLEIAPGESVALVGPTGAGKTTLLSLLPRFHDPQEGRVTIDGQDVRGVTLASLRRRIALVPQEPLLLPVSIAENIAFGRPGATRDEVIAAAVAAEADDFIRRLPEGYDTVVGGRGATLSVGERQRVSIARALLYDAPILLLDEPTASLDADNERRVVAALRRLVLGRTGEPEGQRTCVLIAHRPTTVELATRVVRLEAGAVVNDRPAGAGERSLA
jgi:ATP-binding cassette subfamily B protein/subfamily B ATP-binding cassette protein MsbA